MNIQPVRSSAISGIGHDPETSTLHVKLTSGHTYEYKGVTEEQHDEFISATSIGRHYNDHIRGQFEGRKL